MPVLVAPPVATTANTVIPSAAAAAQAFRSAGPVRRPRSSPGTVTISTSVTIAARRMEECAEGAQATASRWPRPCRRRQVSRAVVSAARLPAVPPETNTPPAPSGKPARSASQRRVAFSAKIAPAPSTHQSP